MSNPIQEPREPGKAWLPRVRKGMKEYRSWLHMRQRCKTSNPYYGGRGIEICDRWNDFSLFASDMGKAPSKDHSIERVDNDGHYELNNCRWASKKEQALNRRSNFIVTYQNETAPLKLLCEKHDLDYKKIWLRIRRYKYTVEEAFNDR